MVFVPSFLLGGTIDTTGAGDSYIGSFLYQVAKDGARAREYEDAVNWLNNSNIVNKIFNVTKPDFPLNAYTDLSSFKLYMLDVGLLRRKANLDSRIVIEGNRLFEEFKGLHSPYEEEMMFQKPKGGFIWNC